MLPFFCLQHTLGRYSYIIVYNVVVVVVVLLNYAITRINGEKTMKVFEKLTFTNALSKLKDKSIL